jgi:hypothetical protein
VDAPDVIELLEFLEESGLDVYVDGGLAVDALLGKRTRSHDDLDVAIPHAQVPLLRRLMATRGFHEQPRADSWECNFVLADAGDRRFDVHSYTLDAAGKNLSGVPYAAEHLTGDWGHCRKTGALHQSSMAREVPHRLQGRRKGLSRRSFALRAIRIAATRGVHEPVKALLQTPPQQPGHQGARR